MSNRGGVRFIFSKGPYICTSVEAQQNLGGGGEGGRLWIDLIFGVSSEFSSCYCIFLLNNFN